MTLIKVSGVTDPADAELAASLGVDMVACVFWAQSPRYVTLAQTWEIRRALPSSIHLTGIFVDAPLPMVMHTMTHGHLDSVQLFGQEDKSDVEQIGGHAFKAVTVQEPTELDGAVRAYLGRRGKSDAAPALLLHMVGELASGWDLVAEPVERASMILAAEGLNDRSAAEAITRARPWAVDVWDAVESEPGQLDADRLARFVDAVRRADAALAPLPGSGE